MVEESFGKSAKGNVDEIRADHLPCILIVYKMKGGVDIRNIIQGIVMEWCLLVRASHCTYCY